MLNKIYHGDCLEVMRGWPDECVDMCVTSPPYWGLRDYGTATWKGGNSECDHVEHSGRNDKGRCSNDTRGGNINPAPVDTPIRYRDVCGKCGARRIDLQIGLEKTPEEYIEKMVAVFQEVRRVLRPWGTVWLNLGDSYAGNGSGAADYTRRNSNTKKSFRRDTANVPRNEKGGPGLKPKDLCMMPARVALALQADGWWLRSDIIWAKPNPMPESVTDRPTSSYEHIFLLTKSAKYFYDAEAVRVPLTTNEKRTERIVYDGKSEKTSTFLPPNPAGRNLRNVWTIATQPYPEAHYATFPEELPRRCILAGTSAKGTCAVCRRPWVRMVEKSKAPHDGETLSAYAGESNARRIALLRQAARERGSEYENQAKTVGWKPPPCDCNADTVPAVVLDPFFGSGTVGVVAEKLQRDWVGIEISREYIEGQAKIRTGLSTSEELMKDKPLFNAG